MIKSILNYLRWLFTIDEESITQPPIVKIPLTADQKEALESKQRKEALAKALSKKCKHHGNISSSSKEIR
jgi:hypothetical protein